MRESPLRERRRLAQVLRELSVEAIRADAPDAELGAVAELLEPLRERLARWPRLVRDSSALMTRDLAEKTGRAAAYDRAPLIGQSSPLAPPLRRVSPDGNEWELRFGELHEGHPDFAHGGFVAAALDHVLGVASASGGVAAMTGTLSVRYRRPTPLRTLLRCRGRITRVEGRKVFCEATLEAEGEVVAEGSGIYLRVDPERYS